MPTWDDLRDFKTLPCTRQPFLKSENVLLHLGGQSLTPRRSFLLNCESKLVPRKKIRKEKCYQASRQPKQRRKPAPGAEVVSVDLVAQNADIAKVCGEEALKVDTGHSPGNSDIDEDPVVYTGDRVASTADRENDLLIATKGYLHHYETQKTSDAS